MANSNGSMAVWCTPRQGGPQSSIETHLNYWRVAGRGKNRSQRYKEDFLEIGAMLTEPAGIDSVNIFIPKRIELSSISDLGEKFIRSDVAQGIFNEVLTCSRPGAGNSYIDLTYEDSTPFCRVHMFAKTNGRLDSSEVTVTAENDGTNIKILLRAIAASARNLTGQSRVYFRLRICVGDKYSSPFVKVITPKDWLLQSGFDEIEYIDFRLNESRTLPDPVDRAMINDASVVNVPTSLVAFLTAVPVQSDLSVSNTEFYKSRLLEDKIWNTYAPKPLPEGMVVYHWKKIPAPGTHIESFAAFVKLQTRRTGSKIMFIYLAIAFLFGIFGNLAASYIQEKTGWPSVEKSPHSADSDAKTNSGEQQRDDRSPALQKGPQPQPQPQPKSKPPAPTQPSGK